MSAIIIKKILVEKGGEIINFHNMQAINSEELEEVLKKHKYVNIEYNQDYEDIIRCEKHYKEKPYQVFYFDYSMNWLQREEFDIKIYSDLLFSENYYSHSGCLQWNYYLVLLYNSEHIITDKKIKNIETNEDFALKFVVNYKKLDEWLNNRYKVVNEQPVEINRDLGILWINKLKENNLDCLYSRSLSVKECVSYYIEGSPILNKLHKALNLYQRALSILESSLGKEHIEIAIILNDMANLYSQMEKYDEALYSLERSFNIFEINFGPNCPGLDKIEKKIQELKIKVRNV